MAEVDGHNLLMSGALGCGKSMIVKRIPMMLPSMTEEEALEVTKIYSVAGLLKSRGTLITEGTFRLPYHNVSMNSLVDGGISAMPREISLAHNGILFLNEIAEFNKKTLDDLRHPMEDGKISIVRARHTHVFLASFMLVSYNAQMALEIIKEYCTLDEESMKMLRFVFDKFRYSARTYYKLLRVARIFEGIEYEIDGNLKLLKSYV